MSEGDPNSSSTPGLGGLLDALTQQDMLPEAELAVLKAKLEAEFYIQSADLVLTGQANERMPGWSQIEPGLTPEVLTKAARMRNICGKPRGYLIPDNGPAGKVQAIDAHKMGKIPGIAPAGHNGDTQFENAPIDDFEFWNGGRPWPKNPQWRYVLADGATKRPYTPTITCTPEDWIIAIVREIEKLGLNVLNELDVYLAMLRQSMAENNPLDIGSPLQEGKRSLIVLNAKNIRRREDPATVLRKNTTGLVRNALSTFHLVRNDTTNFIATGSYNFDQVLFDINNPEDVHAPYLRVRSMLEVDISAEN